EAAPGARGHEYQRESEGVEGEGGAEGVRDRAPPPPGHERGRQPAPEIARDDSDQAEPDRLARAPERETPVDLVPQAAEDHGHELRGADREPVGPAAAEKRAARRDEEVAAEPARERHVPALPELDQVPADEGI